MKVADFIHRQNRNSEKSNVVIGTTAEIIARAQTDGSHKLKAIGRQRFKIIQVADEIIEYVYLIRI